MIKLFKKSVTMGLPRFFVFYCLPILYFVNLTNLSIAFPINYSKEMKKLKERLGGIIAPEDRERKLLEIAVEERYEEHQRAEEFKEQIGAIKAEKVACEQRLKKSACGRQLRFVMEIFGVHQGIVKGDNIALSDGLRETMKKVNSAIQDRRHIIGNHIYYLKKLYEELQEMSPYSGGVLNSDNLKPWSDKVKKQFNSMENIIKKRPIEMDAWSTTRNISDLVIDFNSAANASDAVTVFRKQCDRCFWSKDDTNDDRIEIDKLVAQWSKEEKCALLPEPGYKGLKYDELGFLEGTLNTGRYFIKNNNNYKHCTHVFYYGDAAKVKGLIETIRSEWGKKPFEFIVDQFCYAYSRLYDAISLTDIHAPVDIPEECKPNATDYRQLFKNIAPNPADLEDYVVIAKTFGLITK